MSERRVASLRGTVQGVGFRPFVARLARALGLGGAVWNDGGGVTLRVEGSREDLDEFARRLLVELPPAARIERIEWREEPRSDAPSASAPRSRGGLGPDAEPHPRLEAPFRIEASRVSPRPELTIPPDLGVCAACLAEVGDPSARRAGYPFTNCTSCGPRFSIVESLPYDRARTSMRAFTLCAACRAEYDEPADRRYHAEPIACPACGPTLAFVTPTGSIIARGNDALYAAAEALCRGEIVALKGLGGFQLLVDATTEPAVQRLRDRKHREAKPLAVMVRDLAEADRLVTLTPLEARALESAARPILLARRRPATSIAEAVAPGMPRLGVMLPTTPLHALLLERLHFPVVGTSGNRAGEPIALDEREARAALGGIADAFLTHDRRIVRRADDSVLHFVDGAVRALRVGRGLAPQSLALPGAGEPWLALGSHLANAPALALDGRVLLWPHVGDLDEPTARAAFTETLASMSTLLGAPPERVVGDAHPDYAGSQWAEDSGLPFLRVFHHHAHVASVLAEHGLDHALGVAWDGAGMGPGATEAGAGPALWGGEFLEVSSAGARRVAHLAPFRLLGGESAARDGLRALAGAAAAAGLGAEALPAGARRWHPGLGAPLGPTTTSAGRLFDAVAALAGVAERSAFSGHAAMRLEALAEPGADPYAFSIEHEAALAAPQGTAPRSPAVLDWRPLLRAIAAERRAPAEVASRFHATLVAMITRVALRAGLRDVVLSGGCFQNALLATETAAALRRAGLNPLLPRLLPPGDGGLALGQAWVAVASGARLR